MCFHRAFQISTSCNISFTIFSYGISFFVNKTVMGDNSSSRLTVIVKSHRFRQFIKKKKVCKVGKWKKNCSYLINKDFSNQLINSLNVKVSYDNILRYLLSLWSGTSRVNAVIKSWIQSYYVCTAIIPSYMRQLYFFNAVWILFG